MILAILRAQFLSLRGIGFSRGAASWLGVIPTLAYYVMWAFFSIGAYAGCRLAHRDTLGHILAGGLFGVFLYWQLAPIITASMGASLDLQKLIVYPIDLDRLFIVEVLLRFFTVGEMLIVLSAGGLGLFFNPTLGPWWAVLGGVSVGLILFVLFNLILAAGMRSLIERIFRRKRLREVAMLVFVLICALPGALVAFRFPFERFAALLPLQSFWPWGATAAILVGRDLIGRSGAIATVVLLAWSAAAYRFGRWQFYRVLRADPFAGHEPVRDKRTSSWNERLFTWPSRIWRDPMAAMIEKDLRSLSRCTGFRLAFVMGFTFGLLIFLPQAARASHGTSFMRDHFLAWVSIYSLLLVGFYTYWNAFGVDRSAAQFYFAAPVPFQRVMAAKNLVAVIWQLLELALITIVFFTLRMPMTSFGVAEAFTVTAVSCLYLFAMGNITSVRFANPIDPDKMGMRASSRGRNVFAMLVFPLAFLPIGLAYWGRAVFHSDVVFFLLLAVAALIGGIFYWIGTDSALNITLTRREQMITALSRGQGPLSIT